MPELDENAMVGPGQVFRYNTDIEAKDAKICFCDKVISTDITVSENNKLILDVTNNSNSFMRGSDLLRKFLISIPIEAGDTMTCGESDSDIAAKLAGLIRESLEIPIEKYTTLVNNRYKGPEKVPERKLSPEDKKVTNFKGRDYNEYLLRQLKRKTDRELIGLLTDINIVTPYFQRGLAIHILIDEEIILY